MQAGMINRKHIIFLLMLTVLLSACAGVDSYSGRIIFSGQHNLDGEIAAYGDLIILAGDVEIPGGSRVTGSVYMLGGDLILFGQVDGNLTIVDGSLTLGSNAKVAGDLNLGSSDITRQPGSQVSGSVTEGFALPTQWARQAPTFTEQVRSSLLQMVLMVLLALALKRFLPRPLKRVELTIRNHPLVSVTVGALSSVIALVLFIQLAFTVILIPVSIAGLGLVFLLVTIGWIAIGGLLADLLDEHLPARTSAHLIFLLCVGLVSVLVDALRYVPIVGGPLVLITASAGIGAALLTRFGYQLYTPTHDTELL